MLKYVNKLHAFITSDSTLPNSNPKSCLLKINTRIDKTIEKTMENINN